MLKPFQSTPVQYISLRPKNKRIDSLLMQILNVFFFPILVLLFSDVWEVKVLKILEF